jgi:uncharacterized membrane protein YeaQ/YmgE (transglycosylase-associated protein family)
MNKALITMGMGVGSTIGALLPQLWGDKDLLGGMSILLGLVGGIVGIWLAVKLSKQLS